jgi:hypothetical protein
MKLKRLRDAASEAFRRKQISQTKRPTSDLVLVGWADSPAGRSNLGLTATGLPRLINGYVIRQNQRYVIGNPQPLAHGHACGLEFINLAKQCPGGENHPITDVADHAGAQDSGRDEPQHLFASRHHEGMSCVMPALKAHNALGRLGQPVNDLALAFVTPLGADHHDVLRHYHLLNREE